MIAISPYLKIIRLALEMCEKSGQPASLETVAAAVSMLGKLEDRAMELESRVLAPALSDLPENVIRFRPRAGTQSPTIPTGPDAA